MLSDTVKITIVVIAPVLFFTALLVSVYLYRRHHSPYRHGTFRPENGIWDPSQPERLLPHCCMCYQNHSHEQGLEVSVEDVSSSGSKTDAEERNGSISELHYLEKSVDVRRINHNPYAPDLITRVNSISSTLATQGPANPSLDVLPFGGGRRASHASTVDPNKLGYQGIEANVVGHGAIAVGDRRPSALSGGLSDRRESDKLSIRKVGIGGGEEMVSVQAAGIDDSKLPVRRRSPTPHRHLSRRPSMKDGELQQEESTEPLPYSHPFSATSLSNSTSITQGGGSGYTVPPVPTLNPPPRPQKDKRPGSLKVPSTSTRQSSHPPPSMLASALGPVTGVSTTAIESDRIVSPDHGEISTGSDTSEDLINPTPGLFEAWRGFPRQGSPAKAVLIQPPSFAESPNSHVQHEPPAEPSLGSTSPMTLPPTSAPPRPSQLLPTPSAPSAPQSSSLAPPHSGVERRTSTSSHRSITYLADVVREEARRKSVMAQPLSEPSSTPNTPVTANLAVPSSAIGIGRKSSISSLRSSPHLVIDVVRENSVSRKSATVVPATPAGTRPQSVHVEIVSPNVNGDSHAPMLSFFKFQEEIGESDDDSTRDRAL
ncbi:hypothetical protein IAR50_007230 [Cryptococcus sp. DSM 104548]